MSDLLEQLLIKSKPSEDDVHEAARKAFEEAFEHAKTSAKCVPDDKEELADEKRDWMVEWDASLKRLWDAMGKARKLGLQPTIDKPVLLEFKHLKDTSVRWKEEAQTVIDIRKGSLVTAPEAPSIVSTTGSTSSLSSRNEVASIIRPNKMQIDNQGDLSTEQAHNEAQQTTPNKEQHDPESIQHDTPCDRCAAAAVPCWGILGHVCECCKSVSQRCSKSSGRGGPRVKRKRDADEDTEEAPVEGSRPQRIRTAPKTKASSPPKYAQDNMDEVEIIDSPSAQSKGKQKAHPSKPPKSSKPSVVVAHKNSTTVARTFKPSIIIPPLVEKPNTTAAVPKDVIKTLGELESFALVASAEVKRAQAESKKAEGTLDLFLSEIRSFRTKHNL